MAAKKLNGHDRAAKKREPTPRELYDARLAESGIGRDEAAALKLRLLADASKLGAQYKAYPAIQIPYFDERGKVLPGLFRLRYLGELRGFDRLRKNVRYVQPAGTQPGVYMPPLANWRAIAKDPARGLWVTEGEFKSAAGCTVGLATLGLGGVWSWMSQKAGIGFLPALEAFQWKGRQVWLCFDSDYAQNPDVMRALVAFSREMAARGAVPHLVTLPDVYDDGRKTGLDDFLVHHRGSRAALEKLAEEAEPFNQSEELWQLNSEVVYIRDPGIVVELESGRKMAPGAFKEHAYANRHYYETTFDAKGNQKLGKKPLAPAWLQWEQRAELLRVTYAPGRPRVHERQYNYWPGWACEPKRGDVSLWRELLDYVFGRDAAARKWFEQWAACPVQNPGEKMFSCVALWGAKHGVGKSLMGYAIGSVYGKNFKEIGDDDLGSGFNEWAENRQFVLADDLGSSGEMSRKATYEFMKRTVTRRTLTVNAKYMPTYEVPDVINYLFTANHPDMFALEDEDRRCFVWEMPGEAMPRDFYERWDKWLKDPAGCAPALLWHLQHGVDLTGFNPRAEAMRTAAKSSMIADGKSDVGAWVANLKADPDGSLVLSGGAKVMADLLTTVQLRKMYDPDDRGKVTANGLGRELKRAGFKQVNGGEPVRTAKGPQRLYAIRNIEHWSKQPPLRCAAHWDEHFGPRPEPGRKY